MQAYVFGRHDGEPPTHLVGKTFDGVTVQSMTALEGPGHTLFSKLHLDNEQLLSEPADPVGDLLGDAEVLLGCHDPDCMGLVANIEGRISFIGRDEPYYCFVLCRVSGGVLDHLPAHAQQLGPDRIAAVTDGNGRALIEIAGDDAEELSVRAAQIASHPSISDARIYLSRDLVRAPQ